MKHSQAYFHGAGGYLLARTIAILLVMTLATSMAARQGVVQMAGHQICLQVWLAASLLSDSIALAGQVRERLPLLSELLDFSDGCHVLCIHLSTKHVVHDSYVLVFRQ